jgi:hypothetical protein
MKINAQKFARALKIAQTSCKTRTYLQSVRIEKHESGQGVSIVATNGHILVHLWDTNIHCDSPVNFRNASLKIDKKTHEIEITQSSATINGVTYPNEWTEYESYPTWQRVIPKRVDSMERVKFNPKLLESIRVALDCEFITMTGDASIMMIDGPNENEFGVLMGARQ